MALGMGVGGLTQGADRVIYDRIADGEENKLKDITWDHLEKFGLMDSVPCVWQIVTWIPSYMKHGMNCTIRLSQLYVIRRQRLMH
jgi:hypothetical protein